MFDLNEIKLRASSKSYQLGELLYHADKVSHLSLTDNKVTAIVAGEYDYQVSLLTSDGIAGELPQGETLIASCSCPASTYQDICKHMVAVALLVENSAKEVLLTKSVSVQHDDISAQLKNWFQQKSSVELTEIILDYIEQSENEESRWQLAMRNDQGDLSVAEISKLITKALPAKQVWEWHKVDAYFQHANEMFDEILIAVDKLSLDAQWKLILKLYQRLNKVLEQVDDSGGFRFYIEGQLRDKITTLFNQLGWSDNKKAQWIFSHFETYQYDVFPSVPEDFSLSDDVEALFCASCEAEIEKRMQSSLDLSDRSQKWSIKRLSTPLIEQAKLRGDWQRQCQLMKRVAYNHIDFLAISQICLDNDDQLEAEYYLQQAYQRANSNYETAQCQTHEVKVRIALSENKQAWQLSWQMFTDAPSFRTFKKLTQLEQQIGVVDAEFIRKVEPILANCYGENRRGLSANADALFDFYLDQNELSKARQWVLTHKANSVSLLKLANLIVVSHSQESVDLYYRVLNGIINQAKNSAYQEATDLLLRLEKGFSERDQAHAILYRMIADLIKKQKAKRNLMKLLKVHFAQCFD
ncbi:MAG: SWIM zinc finger family protein [Psychromonas sp.]